MDLLSNGEESVEKFLGLSYGTAITSAKAGMTIASARAYVDLINAIAKKIISKDSKGIKHAVFTACVVTILATVLHAVTKKKKLEKKA